MSKIIAMYLPQYHEIPENDKWWGKGFTDWVSVKNAIPLFPSHIQPKKPYQNNYYDLGNKENIKWQIGLAKSNGIYGFGIYHYWFSSNLQLLQKPAELILNNKDLDIPFFFAWDNSTWIRTWSNLLSKQKYINDWSPEIDNITNHLGDGVLAKLDYGTEEDWIKHFNYLLPFFLDSRYIKVNNSPVFVIWNNNEENTLVKMMNCWKKLAIKSGFSGIMFISRYDPLKKTTLFDKYFNYEPNFSTNLNKNFFARAASSINRRVFRKSKLKKYSYDSVWRKSISFAKKNINENIFYGAFVNYDDTPRRGNKGTVILNGTPQKFKKYLSELTTVSNSQNKEFIFLTAWNEWGEGAYLEPDTIFKFAYLSAIKKIFINNN